MIYRMTHDLAASLYERKFPCVVCYGSERFERQGFHSCTIVVEHDSSRSGSVGSASGYHRNARKVLTRTQPVKATIYAQSGVAGARLAEHQHECDRVVDGFLSALHEWQTKARAGDLSVSEARYLSGEERSDTEGWPGAVYLVRFAIPRAVDMRDYEGDALATAVIAHSENAVIVSSGGAPEEI